MAQRDADAAARADGTGSPAVRPGLTPAATLGLLVERTLAGPPLLGTTRLVSIDGPAGSGKSTLAADLAGALRDRGPNVRLLGMDDLFEGWAGLDAGTEQLVSGVLEPLSRGEAGAYRRWDWHASAWAETVVVEPPGVLVVEGCGSGPRAAAPWTSLLVVVETDAEERLARGIARDGEAMRADWLRWMALEESVLTREGTRERADLRLDGRGRTRP